MNSLRARAFPLLLSVALSFSGCAIFHPKTKPPAPAPTPAPASAMPTPSPTPAPVAMKSPLWINALTGFGIMQKIFPPKKKPPKAQAIQMIGTIKMVNKEEKFVLIDALVYQNAGSDDVLICITGQKQTATLRTSNLRNPPFLVADITDGDPSPGDQVFKP